jgi:DDE family transposase
MRMKQQWLVNMMRFSNRYPLRQRTLPLPAAYPRIDRASLPQQAPQRFGITGRRPLGYHTCSYEQGLRVPGHLDRFPVESSPPPISMSGLTPGRGARRVGTWQTWITRQLAVRQRRERICTRYLLVLMVMTTKHSRAEAARFAGRQTSLFSHLLQSHAKGAITTRENLSKTPARQDAQALQRVQGLPWKIVILIDRTRQPRASLHPANPQTFTPGTGEVMGHPWTNIVLVVGDILMPLKPIPFESKRDCQTHDLASQSAHERVVAYRDALDREVSLGADDRREVRVLTASGYDEKKIETAIVAKGWTCISAFRKTRRVKAQARALRTPTSQQWCPLDTFCRRHRRLKWNTMRLATRGTTRTRMDLRLRHPSGSLRSVGQVELVCSARRNRPEGRRTSLACHDLRATARHIVTGYRRRGAVELFHQCVKQHLGFEDVAPHGFDAVISHVHWVYCAESLLHLSPPGLSPGSQSLGDKPRALQQGLADQEKRQLLQKLTQIGGVQRDKDELRQALAGP